MNNVYFLNVNETLPSYDSKYFGFFVLDGNDNFYLGTETGWKRLDNKVNAINDAFENSILACRKNKDNELYYVWEEYEKKLKTFTLSINKDRQSIHGQISIINQTNEPISVETEGYTEIYTYEEGTEVTLSCTPDNTYEFTRWIIFPGGTTDVDHLILTMDEDKSVNATCSVIMYNVKVESYIRTDEGDILSTDPVCYLDKKGQYEHKYSMGNTVKIAVEDSDSYKFVEWDDGNTSKTRNMTVNGDITYKAYFIEKINYNVFVISTDNEELSTFDNIRQADYNSYNDEFTISYDIPDTALSGRYLAFIITTASMDVINTQSYLNSISFTGDEVILIDGNTYTNFINKSAKQTFIGTFMVDADSNLDFTIKIGSNGLPELSVTETNNEYLYTMVTNVDDLKNGDKIILASKASNVILKGGPDYTSSLSSVNNYSTTISGNAFGYYIDESDLDKYALDLEIVNGNYYLKSGSVYICEKSSGNGVSTTTDTSTAKNTITIDSSGNATIKNSVKTIYYNSNVGYFRYYGSTQSPIQIFRKS